MVLRSRQKAPQGTVVGCGGNASPPLVALLFSQRLELVHGEGGQGVRAKSGVTQGYGPGRELGVGFRRRAIRRYEVAGKDRRARRWRRRLAVTRRTCRSSAGSADSTPRLLEEASGRGGNTIFSLAARQSASVRGARLATQAGGPRGGGVGGGGRGIHHRAAAWPETQRGPSAVAG